VGRIRQAIRTGTPREVGRVLSDQVAQDTALTGEIPWSPPEFHEAFNQQGRAMDQHRTETEADRQHVVMATRSRRKVVMARNSAALHLLSWFDRRYGHEPPPTALAHFFRYHAIIAFVADHWTEASAAGLSIAFWSDRPEEASASAPARHLLQALCVLPYDRAQNIEETRRTMKARYDVPRVLRVAKRWLDLEQAGPVAPDDSVDEPQPLTDLRITAVRTLHEVPLAAIIHQSPRK
jgi:hypothetical protein